MKLQLRPWQVNDLPALVQNANDPMIAANMTDSFVHPYTIAAGEAFLQRVVADDPAKVLAIEVDGEAAGSIGIFQLQDIFHQNAELGYWLARKHWGKGIMSQAVEQMIQYGFRSFPAVQRIFARPFGRNMASQRVLDKAGMKLEARFAGTICKNGEAEDELIYSIRRMREK